MMSMTMDEKMIEDCREQIGNREFVKCEQMLRKAMEEEPHSAVPHNLMGIFLEKKGEHSLAMKHFRAAYALDPSCAAARFNLEQFSQMESVSVKCAYADADCQQEKPVRFFVKFMNPKHSDKDCKKEENNQKKIHHNSHFAWNFN